MHWNVLLKFEYILKIGILKLCPHAVSNMNNVHCQICVGDYLVLKWKRIEIPPGTFASLPDLDQYNFDGFQYYLLRT